MKKLSILFITLFLASAAFASSTSDKETKAKAQKWNFDKSHSAVNFSVRHILTPVTGSFGDFGGDVYFDPTNLAESSINVSIDVKSIDTKNAKRDGHLHSDDFFSADKFPKITFVSNKIEKTGDNTFVAKGKLTVKDVTKDIELPFTLLGTMAHPFKKDGTKIAAFEAGLKINRNEFKVGTGDWVQTAIVGEDVEVKVTLEMTSAN